MLPIGPLMIEHRLIERVVKLMESECLRCKTERKADPLFIDAVVDFFRTYADRTHHGKEEDILFRKLAEKELSPEHEKTMNELIEEHKIGRKTVGELHDAKERYVKGESGAVDDIVACLDKLTAFYPAHIETEDEHFFLPAMDYFTAEEQAEMLRESEEFDANMIHAKYDGVVAELEAESR
ncbi:MAG: hemerythrin domain-containing protein [Candidatus Coatesbacteria bacterium]|nr:MAG: hemerythrin domain-containing protein [Candidatus Coatesbacteria bacterium]